LNNSVKNEPILIAFGTQNPETDHKLLVVFWYLYFTGSVATLLFSDDRKK